MACPFLKGSDWSNHQHAMTCSTFIFFCRTFCTQPEHGVKGGLLSASRTRHLGAVPDEPGLVGQNGGASPFQGRSSCTMVQALWVSRQGTRSCQRATKAGGGCGLMTMPRRLRSSPLRRELGTVYLQVGGGVMEGWRDER